MRPQRLWSRVPLRAAMAPWFAGYFVLALVAGVAAYTHARVRQAAAPLHSVLGVGASSRSQIQVLVLSPGDCSARWSAVIAELDGAFTEGDADVVGVVVGAADDDETRKALTAAVGATFPVLFSGGSGTLEALARLGYHATPVVVTLDSRGRLMAVRDESGT